MEEFPLDLVPKAGYDVFLVTLEFADAIAKPLSSIIKVAAKRIFLFEVQFS
jgi:hypothetical protein